MRWSRKVKAGQKGVSDLPRLGAKWRVLLDETDAGWRAMLLERETGDLTPIGEYDLFGQAKKESEKRARELITERTAKDPGPVSDWRKIPNIGPLEPESKFRYLSSIL